MFHKGSQLPVIVEEASADIVVVSMKIRGRTLRGVLLDSQMRNSESEEKHGLLDTLSPVQTRETQQPLGQPATRRDVLSLSNTYKSAFKLDNGAIKQSTHNKIPSPERKKTKQRKRGMKRKLRGSSTRRNKLSRCDIKQGILGKQKRRSDSHDAISVDSQLTKKHQFELKCASDCSHLRDVHLMNGETVTSLSTTMSKPVNTTRESAASTYSTHCIQSMNDRGVSTHAMVQSNSSGFAYPYLGSESSFAFQSHTKLPYQSHPSQVCPDLPFNHIPSFITYGLWNTSHPIPQNKVTPAVEYQVKANEQQSHFLPALPGESYSEEHFSSSTSSLHPIERPPPIDTPVDSCNGSDEELRHQPAEEDSRQSSTNSFETTTQNHSSTSIPTTESTGDDRDFVTSQAMQPDGNKASSKNETNTKQKSTNVRQLRESRKETEKEIPKRLTTKTRSRKSISQNKRLRTARKGTVTTEEDAALFEALWISKQEQNFNKNPTVPTSPQPQITTEKRKRVYVNHEFFYSPRPSSSRSKCPNDDAPRYKIDDIVWAKLVSRPWWPAKILSFIKDVGRSNHSMYDVSVQWLGKTSNCTDVLPSSLICPFSPTFHQHYLPDKKTSTYVKAIEEALQQSGLEPNHFTRSSN